MTFYGLYSKKRNCLMAFSTSSNEGDFCNDVEYELSIYSGDQDSLWVISNREVAEIIAETGPTPWYNAAFHSPIWDESYYGKLEVVNLSERGELK